MTQYRTVQRTVDAEQYDGTNVPWLRHWGAQIVDTPTGPQITVDDGSAVPLLKDDWIIRTVDGHVTCPDVEFMSCYVGARKDDEQAVVFKMKTVDGNTITATVEGWVNGKDAVRALMHVGRPEVVLEFVKEQVTAGDLSMIGLMNELAKTANPGE